MKVALIAVLALAFSASAPGASITPFEAEHGEQPNHLQPVSRESSAYDRLVQRRLVSGGTYGTFICLPSFEREVVVAVDGTDDPLAPNPFGITVTRPEKSLWLSMPENNNERRWKAVRINRAEIAIDRELAVAIQRAWASMLLRTRYPRKAYLGTDGATFQFSVFVRNLGLLHGEIWSPDRGLPKEFVELGYALLEHATTSPKERAATRTHLLKRLRRFERRARSASSR